MSQKKILLTEWAERRFSPPPPLFTLRRWARDGEIQPEPEKVGKAYYVLENAERVGVPAAPVELPPAPSSPSSDESGDAATSWWADNWTGLVVTPSVAAANCRDFYDPGDVACGVYLVLEPDRRSVAYVGSSVQLQNRLRNGGHLPADAPTFCLSVPEPFVRGVEAAYYTALKPRLNRKSPPGSAAPELVDAVRAAWGSKR